MIRFLEVDEIGEVGPGRGVAGGGNVAQTLVVDSVVLACTSVSA